MITLTDHVTLWFEQDRPVRLYWREQRWRVTDTPTPLYTDADDVPPMITHPGKRQTGWRFQATSETGETFVLDALGDDSGWAVVHACE